MKAYIIYFCGLQLQDRAVAIAERKPAPTLSESSDVRPLNLEDYKSAHEQV